MKKVNMNLFFKKIIYKLFYFSDEVKKLVDGLGDDLKDYKMILQNDKYGCNLDSSIENWGYESNGNDKVIKEKNEKLFKIFSKISQAKKCIYRGQLKNASESAESSKKMNDEQRKQFIDGVDEIDEILSQTNYNEDKDTLLNDRNAVCNKLRDLKQVLKKINVSKDDPEFLNVVNMGFETKMPKYFQQLYTLGIKKQGKKRNQKDESAYTGDYCA